MRRLLLAALMALGPTLAAAYSGEYFVTCNLDPNGDNFLALRSCPSSSCEMLATLGPNTFLLTLEPTGQGRWREVIPVNGLDDAELAGPKGWVYDAYICAVTY